MSWQKKKKKKKNETASELSKQAEHCHDDTSLSWLWHHELSDIIDGEEMLDGCTSTKKNDFFLAGPFRGGDVTTGDLVDTTGREWTNFVEPTTERKLSWKGDENKKKISFETSTRENEICLKLQPDC